MEKVDALTLRVNKLDMHLAEAQGAQRALEISIAGLIATHPDPARLQAWLSQAEKNAPAIQSAPAHLGYESVRTRLAKVLLKALGQPVPPG